MYGRILIKLNRAVQPVAAATEDSRFPPLTQEELADITIEISVLSPFRRVTDVAQVEVGTHRRKGVTRANQSL